MWALLTLAFFFGVILEGVCSVLMKLMVLGRVSIFFYWVLLHFLNLSTAIGSLLVKTIISHKRVLYTDDLGAIVLAFLGMF